MTYYTFIYIYKDKIVVGTFNYKKEELKRKKMEYSSMF